MSSTSSVTTTTTTTSVGFQTTNTTSPSSSVQVIPSPMNWQPLVSNKIQLVQTVFFQQYDF